MVCLLPVMTESNRSSPWVTLWYKPGHTLQGLIADGKGRTEALAIAGLFGLVQVWPAYSSRESSHAGLLLAGVLGGAAGLFFFSWLLRNFSRWFGGGAHLADVRTALGWGLLPWSVLFVLLLVRITMAGGEAAQMFPLFFAAILYGFVIVLTVLSVALKLSLIKTFLCLVLTVVVSIFPLTFMMQLLMGAPESGA